MRLSAAVNFKFLVGELRYASLIQNGNEAEHEVRSKFRQATVKSQMLLWVALFWPLHASAQGSLPPDVIQFAKGRDACDHFRGEEPYDAERRKFLEDRTRKLCVGTDRKLQALKQKYRRQPEILDKLNAYELHIE